MTTARVILFLGVVPIATARTSLLILTGTQLSQGGALLLGSKWPRVSAQRIPKSPVWCLGGDDGGDGGANHGGRGRNDDENDDDWDDEVVERVLAKYGVESELLPSDMLEAVRAGRLSTMELSNWNNIVANPLTRVLASSAYIRDRLLAEPRLLAVLCIEIGVGSLSTLAAELTARGDKFRKELDFVIANQVLIVLTNLALVLALCPAAAIAAPPAAGSFASWYGRLPGFFLQKGEFSVLDRTACFTSKALQFSLVGALTSAVGQATTMGLVELRTKLNPDDPPAVQLAPVLPTSVVCRCTSFACFSTHTLSMAGFYCASRPTLIRGIALSDSDCLLHVCAQAYATFMAASSNTRYQIVNSFEALVLPMVPGGQVAQTLSSFVLRTCNN